MMDQDIKCVIKEKKLSKSEKNNMYDHPAQSSRTIIPRTFRWTLTNENHPEIHYWMKSIKTDYVNKKIIMQVYDDAKGTVFNWLQALVDKNKNASEATLTHFDSSGETISLISFSGLTLDEHLTEYDYKSSEILTHKVILLYKKANRENQKTVQYFEDAEQKNT